MGNYLIQGMTDLRRDREFAVAILLALVAHAALTKVPDLLPEMLYACHVASLILAIGLLTQRSILVGIGFVFHLGVGFPTWGLDIAVMQTTTPTSILVHVLPLLAGYFYLRKNGIPRLATAGALGMCALLVPISYWGTPPALNVNVVHRVWEPFADIFSSQVVYLSCNFAVAAVLMTLAQMGFASVVRKTQHGMAK